MTPPRVMTFALGKISKYIHKTSRDELIDTLTFLFGIPMLAFVLFWIGEVLRRVRDVQIAAKNDRLFLFKELAVGEECRVPVLVAQFQTA